MKVAQILATIDIFTDLTSAQLDQIATICTPMVFQKGADIVVEGAPTTEIYIILEGEVEILVGTRGVKTAKEKRIGILDRGQSFGEVALVDEGLRSATVRCYSDNCRLLEIKRDVFLRFLKEKPEIGFIVMYNLAADICLKFREASLR